MKTKLLFTIAGLFVMANLLVFLSVPEVLANGNSPEVQFADGKVLTVKILCEELNNSIPGDAEERKVSIYLPPGYDENGKKNYPVIYMLPDFKGSNEDWFQVFSQQNFPEVLDKMILSKKIKPMILVFPDGNSEFGGAWYSNSSVSGNWEGFVTKDLVNYVDKNFKTLPFAGCRAIAGKGMGAFGALKLAGKYPDVFSSVYALNAVVDLKTLCTEKYIWANSIQTAREATVYPTNDALANQLLSMSVAFAPNKHNGLIPGNLPWSESGEIIEDVLNKWLEHDPLQMIQLYSENLKDLKTLVIDCSTDDAGILLNNNYSEALKKAGVNHSFNYFSGSESSILLKQVTENMLPEFSTQLSHSLLDCNAKVCLTHSDVLKSSMIADGTIYLTPVQETPEGFTTKSGNIQKYYVKANQVKEIPLLEFPKGIYSMYGVSASGFNGEPVVFGINGGTPQVKICVTDSYTGKKIKTCQLTVDGKVCEPDENGDHCFNAEGTITLCTGKENYGTLTKNATIYTDTTITISLVKNSQIQVIEKGYNIPIYEAMVTQNNQATLTNKSGFTTIFNVQDEMLDCRVFKSGYFTEVVHTPIIPGATKIIELTKKKASIDFYVAGSEGPTFGIYVDLDGMRLYTDENGKVSFNDLDTRVEYFYTINDYNHEEVKGSIFLESHNVITINLQPKNNSSTANKSGWIETNGITNTDHDVSDNIFKVYPNPAKEAITIETDGREIYTVELTTQSGSSVYKTTMEGNRHRINLSNLSNGVYFVTVKSNNVHRTQRIMKL